MRPTAEEKRVGENLILFFSSFQDPKEEIGWMEEGELRTDPRVIQHLLITATNSVAN